MLECCYLMTDEGLHEVQLNGKQLVFLFIVGTVFTVVVFLSGVMVGRGVRTPAGLDPASTSAASTIDPTAAVGPAAASPSADGTPVSAGESLSYAERLESPTPARETLGEAQAASSDTPSVTTPTPAAQPPVAVSLGAVSLGHAASGGAAVSSGHAASGGAATAAAAPTRAGAAPPALDAAGTALFEPAGNGFVVQVMAVNTRAEADTIAKRLASKGYPTFVTTTGAGAKVSYRVRVGKYDDKREADAVSARLQKEEQFNPWVTR